MQRLRDQDVEYEERVRAEREASAPAEVGSVAMNRLYASSTIPSVPGRLHESGEILETMAPDDREPLGLCRLDVRRAEHAVDHGAGNNLPAPEFVKPRTRLADGLVVDPLEGVDRAVG